ncbi:MAG TPA: HNH endonuclease family protein [Pilimelia sp.]|nr:HNH endonuclease family protein [Pilimelia sp.]
MPTLRTSAAARIALVAGTVATLALGGCVVGEATGPATGSRQETVRQLDALTVAPAGSMKGYSRAKFPHWKATGGNCDVRDTVLRRDGEDVRLRGCNVVGGRWRSPYDERVLTSTAEVDVDHVVPLANAWRSGAARWPDRMREAFANDLEHPQLRAVSRTANRAKGDQDPSQWKPPNRRHWCRYAQDWIAVKAYWRLAVTTAEKAALHEMLENCQWPSNRRNHRT